MSKSPSSHLFHRKLQKFMSKVEAIHEDSNENTQSSPQKPPLFKKTHKIITSVYNIEFLSPCSISSFDFDENLATNSTIPPKRTFTSLPTKKSQSNMDFSSEMDKISLKSEISQLNLETDSCFSYVSREEDFFDISKEKIEKARVLQRFWQMISIHRNYKKLLRKIKLLEILIVGLEKALEMNSKDCLKKNLKKTRDLQEKIINKLREGKPFLRKKMEKRRKIMSCMEIRQL